MYLQREIRGIRSQCDVRKFLQKMEDDTPSPAPRHKREKDENIAAYRSL